MAFYFVLTSITTALVLSVVLAFTWEGQFQSYARQNMQRLAEQTAENLPAASTPRALTGSRRPRHAPAPGARRAA